MTVSEQRFMETVPAALRDIAKSLEAIDETLRQIAQHYPV